MPYYKITFRDRHGKLYSGIKTDDNPDIEVVDRKAYRAAILAMGEGNVLEFQICMITANSFELQDYRKAGKVVGHISIREARTHKTRMESHSEYMEGRNWAENQMKKYGHKKAGLDRPAHL
jgi:hypothetical protein